MLAIVITRKGHVAGNIVVEDLGLTVGHEPVYRLLPADKVRHSLTSGSLSRLQKLKVISVTVTPVDEVREPVAYKPEAVPPPNVKIFVPPGKNKGRKDTL